MGKGVFHVAHQTKSCTMGAQMGQLMPVQSFGVENNETLVGMIDLQGQGDGTVSRDINVSVPMLMISSVLIFNCPPGRPAKGDFSNRFAVMLECAKKIKPKNSNNVFGNLIIVCRDCNLDEEEIFTEFFEDEDEEDVDTHEESEACDRRNKMRKTIRKCFQRIEVVTLPVPHHNASERGLTPDDALLPEFMEKVDRLKELIGQCCISPKALVDANGNKVSFTGSMIPTYLKNICDATRDPDLKLSPPDMMQALIAKLGEEAMSSLETFASTIHVNLPLEDNVLSIELAKVEEEFKKLKQRELEKSPIVKSDEVNRRCNELLESKLVEIRNKKSILMEKQIAQEKARRETERAENEALKKKEAEEKARLEGERAESEKKQKLKAENKAHMAEVRFRKVVKQADEDRKFMESQVEHAARLTQTAQEDNQKIRRDLEVVSHEAKMDKQKMNAKLQDMHAEVANANARAHQAQTQAAADRDNLNAKVDKLQNELADARTAQHQHGHVGGGVIVMTNWGPMLLH